MEAHNSECRWRFTPATWNVEVAHNSAWETSCGQWCIESEGTPQADGFKNGFEYCPYCGQHLVLLLRAAEVA